MKPMWTSGATRETTMPVGREALTNSIDTIGDNNARDIQRLS